MWLKGIHILPFALCLTLIRGQGEYYQKDHGPCTVPPPENVAHQLREIEPEGRYPSHKIRDFLDQPVNQHFRSLIEQTKSSLKFCSTEKHKLSFPGISYDLKFSRTCPEEHKTLLIPEKVLYDGDKCWVLRPWAGYWCGYIDCGTENCAGVTPVPEIPFSDQFKCRTTNNRLVDVMLFCEEVKNYFDFYSMRLVTLRLPQCCSCVRFDCLLKG